MPRHEPLGRPAPGEVLKGKMKMRLDENGKWQVVPPEGEQRPTAETHAQPVHPDDPRPGAWRNIPPIGSAG
jgi:hypothetical protein